MRVYGLNAIGVATEIEHVESVEWSDVIEVGRDTVRVTAPPTNSNLTLRPDRIIVIPTEPRGMLFGPYDAHAETSAGEVGMLTWTGSKGRRYNETYAEQQGEGAALEAITEQLGIWTLAIDPWATWKDRPATSLDRMLALIFAQTYQTASLASMRDVLERWGLSLTVDLQQTGVDVAAGVYPIRVEILPLFPIDATPRKRRAVVVDIGDDGLPAAQSQIVSARVDPVPLTLPVDADATQVETPDVWNRPGAYARRRIVAARQSLGFGVEVLYESHATSAGADPTIYLQDVTAEDFALQLAENERWRLQNTAQSARIRQAVPYWNDAIVDELTLQPLDLVSIDAMTLRVESVEHEWSATTGYLRTLNCWLWQGYFGADARGNIVPPGPPPTPGPVPPPGPAPGPIPGALPAPVPLMGPIIDRFDDFRDQTLARDGITLDQFYADWDAAINEYIARLNRLNAWGLYTAMDRIQAIRAFAYNAATFLDTFAGTPPAPGHRVEVIPVVRRLRAMPVAERPGVPENNAGVFVVQMAALLYSPADAENDLSGIFG